MQITDRCVCGLTALVTDACVGWLLAPYCLWLLNVLATCVRTDSVKITDKFMLTYRHM